MRIASAKSSCINSFQLWDYFNLKCDVGDKINILVTGLLVFTCFIFTNQIPSRIFQLFTLNVSTAGNMKCPKKYVKEEFIMWWNMHFFRNAPKSKMFIFGSFSVFKIKWEKWGISKKTSVEKWGISKKNAYAITW